MPRALRRPWGEVLFLMSEVPLYLVGAEDLESAALVEEGEDILEVPEAPVTRGGPSFQGANHSDISHTTLNPKPKTTNLEPQTPNPKP